MDSNECNKNLNISQKLKIESLDMSDNTINPSPTTEDGCGVGLNTFNFSEEKKESVVCKVEETGNVKDSKELLKQILTSNISKNSFGSFSGEQVHYRAVDSVDNEQKKNFLCSNLEKNNALLVKEKLNFDVKSDESDAQTKSLPTKESKPILNFVMKKIVNLPEGYTDSSHSSSSELQSSAIPFESSSSSVENIYRSSRINFENALKPTPVWKESDDNSFTEVSLLSKPYTSEISHSEVLSAPSTNVITLDDNVEPTTDISASSSLPLDSDQPRVSEYTGSNFSNEVQINGEAELKPDFKKDVDSNIERPDAEFSAPVPVVPPAPRKRGRPRKQVLPNPSPLLEAWGSNTPQLPAPGSHIEIKRSTRSERRTRKKRFEDIENGKTNFEECATPKRRYTIKSPLKKKKKKPVYVPKKRGPKPSKKHSEMENIQNFEEETRMSASEGHGGFSARSGALGDDSQSSFLAEGHTKSNINKKGRMEVMTDSCKPVTVQQIVEYHWPPPSSLSHGEKSEGLMIQEQITEYLGVKSFKRKYPSIKRRAVEMEERNYLQENGFVSENMCDMGLTAVFSADIIEIMYNDFPHKFEEYRKYTREKKVKEQRALREKQAAERADMDPFKEAIESAQSWNSEFNKTRRFKVLHIRPELRQLSDGSPCGPFERLILNHAPDNAPLCIETDTWKMSLFSYECEISTRNKSLFRNKIDPANVWMFLVGSV